MASSFSADASAPAQTFTWQHVPRPTPLPELTALSATRWITDGAWITGLTGALAVVVLAIYYQATDALSRGVVLGPWRLTESRQDSLLLALISTAVLMVAVEWLRVARFRRGDFIHLSPLLAQRRWAAFLSECLLNFALYLLLLKLVILFYHSALEYGYARGAPYYQGWFRFLEWAWAGYLWLGLPYVLLTRALQHDPAADRQDFTRTFTRAGRWSISWLPGMAHWREPLDLHDRKNALALLVKLFFAPLMTVFFCDQFPHLVKNCGTLAEAFRAWRDSGDLAKAVANSGVYNIGVAGIFAIDVAIAWCGYITATRWLGNQTLSAEPTLLGWIVCIVCYPPFQMFLGLYFAAPSDSSVMQLNNPLLATVLTALMVLSYLVYMLATVWFGVRFSNLTNRGIIRTGPYALVRHPAYASKNFAWWCLMFPVVIYNAFHTGLALALAQTAGLILLTGCYYLRALTEERHLMADPHYQAYCRQVPYRFIPGVL